MRTRILITMTLAAVLLQGCIIATDSDGRDSSRFAREPTLGQELLDLDRARDAGAISEAGYDRLKARIIDRANHLGSVMGIFSRLSDIINSNITVLLDKAEDPEKMVRMVIQEMEETLVEVRSNSARIIADKKELVRRNAKLEQQARDWEAKAELALSKGREDLAKAALLEKAAVNEMVAQVNGDLVRLDESLDKLSVEIEQLQAKLNEARSRQKTILMRTRATESRKSVSDRLYSADIDRAISR